MPVPTLTVLASLLQMHGPGATIQSDHQGIDALLGDIRGQISQQGTIPGQGANPDKPVATQVYFRRGGFVRGGGYGGGGFRKAGYVGPAGGFRRGGFVRGY